MENKVYYVLKLDYPPKRSLDKLLCVPESWTRPPEGAPGVPPDRPRVRVWYPLEAARTTEDRVKNQWIPDMNQWGMYMAGVHYKGDYRDAQQFISDIKFFMKRIIKNNMLGNQNTAQNIAANYQLPDHQLPSTSATSQREFTVKSEVNCPEVYEIDDDSEEEVTSNDNPSSPIDCLPTIIQKLLQEIEKVTQGRYRFEFDEIRYVRECDNVVIDSRPNLAINADGVMDEAVTEDVESYIKQEVTSTSDRGTQGHTPSPSLRGVSIHPVPPPHQSPRSIHPAMYVAPSSGPPSNDSHIESAFTIASRIYSKMNFESSRVGTPSSNGRVTVERVLSPNYNSSPHTVNSSPRDVRSPIVGGYGGKRPQNRGSSGCTVTQGHSNVDIRTHVGPGDKSAGNSRPPSQNSIDLASFTLTINSGNSNRRLGEQCEQPRKKRRE